ncbi:hypothetical protein FB451DRAFT_96141 [Mycena latifolia]|nr:hypothetical protein FB451DRAFT_96141 [Mycena latifolia]
MSSPFTSKLGTNYCPQDEEISEIQTLLTEPTLRLKRLDDEIADLQKALDKLAEERAGLSAFVDAHRALISPVRRLPLDIIQEIFVACLPAHRNCVMSAVEAPVLLGRICSSWRSISLSTPRLWSRLHIVEPTCPYNAPAMFKEKVAQRLETTKMWLGRSGRCPLSISLQSTFDHTGFTSATPNRLIQDLLPFASRWEHISFTALFSSLTAMTHLTPADVPMLKSVTISEIQEHIAAADRYNSMDFLHGPKISSFNLMGSNFSPLELPLRWDRLMDLSIVEKWSSEAPFLTSEMTLQVFSRCPQLQTCRLLVHDPPDSSNRIGEPVLELSFLHTLDLDCDTFWTTAPRLFGRLSFPQLRNLKLRGISADDNVPYAPLLATAQLIEKLDFAIELFSKSLLVNFLRDLPPTLRELKISKFLAGYYDSRLTFDDGILESLSPSADVLTPCCPGLQELEMDYSCTVSDKALLRFIRSRALKRVVIRFDRAMELDIRPELEPLVKNGLHLALTYHAPRMSFSPWIGLGDAPNFFQAP